MTVLLKIVDNSITALLKSLNVLLESIDSSFGMLIIKLLEKRSASPCRPTGSYGSNKDKTD